MNCRKNLQDEIMSDNYSVLPTDSMLTVFDRDSTTFILESIQKHQFHRALEFNEDWHNFSKN